MLWPQIELRTVVCYVYSVSILNFTNCIRKYLCPPCRTLRRIRVNEQYMYTRSNLCGCFPVSAHWSAESVGDTVHIRQSEISPPGFAFPGRRSKLHLYLRDQQVPAVVIGCRHVIAESVCIEKSGQRHELIG